MPQNFHNYISQQMRKTSPLGSIPTRSVLLALRWLSWQSMRLLTAGSIDYSHFFLFLFIIKMEIIHGDMNFLTQIDMSSAKTVGKGAFGVVKKVLTTSGQEIILKEIEIKSERQRERVFTETKYINLISDVDVYLAFFDKSLNTITIYMDYIPGIPCSFFLSNENGEMMDFNETLQLFKYLLSRFVLCNSFNIIHGDIKADNIIYDRQHNKFTLIDYGNSCNLITNRNYCNIKHHLFFTPMSWPVFIDLKEFQKYMQQYSSDTGETRKKIKDILRVVKKIIPLMKREVEFIKENIDILRKFIEQDYENFSTEWSAIGKTFNNILTNREFSRVVLKRNDLYAIAKTVYELIIGEDLSNLNQPSYRLSSEKSQDSGYNTKISNKRMKKSVVIENLAEYQPEQEKNLLLVLLDINKNNDLIKTLINKTIS